MLITCFLILELGKAPNTVLVPEEVQGTVLDQSDLRYLVDFSRDIQRITWRDPSINWRSFLVKKDQCVQLR